MAAPVTTTTPPRRPDDRRARAQAQGRLRWELVSQLVRKDLKVKYQGSTLGFVWSLANPLILLGIYYVIFTYVFPAGIPEYAVYLMAGLLPFTAFSQGVAMAAGSVVGSAGLVKKVRFPLLVLPLSAVGFALVQFALQFALLLAIVAGVTPDRLGVQLVLLLPAFALLVLFTTALGTLVSALNVRYRDTSHFVEIAMLVWFWANPILYAAGFLDTQLHNRGLGWLYDLYFLNPMATVVATVQRAVYGTAYAGRPGQPAQQVLAAGGYTFYLEYLAAGFAVSGLLLLLARFTFRRLQADFAEEL